jgi:hypothetical protein
MLLKILWVVTRRHFLVYDQRFGITCLSHLQVLFPKNLKMGQTSDPETLVIHQKMTPGNKPEDFKQHRVVVLQVGNKAAEEHITTIFSIQPGTLKMEAECSCEKVGTHLPDYNTVS